MVTGIGGRKTILATILVASFAVAAQQCPAQEARFELGQRVRAFEIAWEQQTDATARARAVPHLNAAVTNFFSFKLDEAGRSLDQFDLPQLLAMIASFDAESVALLESYLDRRFPAWRQHAQGDAAGGQRRAAASGKMTDEEAYQILGLQPGAGRDDIARAHRSLMKKLHPDQGGSTYLAARVNEAKDTLLRTHHS